MLAMICLGLAALIVGTVVLVALMGWGGPLRLVQRIGLLGVAGGMAWAGPGRWAGEPLGLGDLVLLASLLGFLISTFGPALLAHADAADGAADGRVSWPRRAR